MRDFTKRNKFLYVESTRIIIRPFGPILALVLGCLPAVAGKPFRGPVEAIVVRVLDGDTFVADAAVWPGQTLRVNVRIRGIDAPEMKARCEGERMAAKRAREELAVLLGGRPVAISNIAGAKYYGRVLADVANAEGLDVGPAMMERRLVRAYAGGRRDGWCG